MIGHNSSLSLWIDRWLDAGPLCELIQGPLNIGEEQLLVRDIVSNGSWNLHECSFFFHTNLVKKIRAIPIPMFSNISDSLSWVSSSSGRFDTRNAYTLACDNPIMQNPFGGTWIWKVDTLPKIQMFIWKCFLNSIPVKDVLPRTGIELDASCVCCGEGPETIAHVLRD